MSAKEHRLTGMFTPWGSVCIKAPNPFWTIIAFRVMWWSLCLPLVRSSGTFSSPLSFRPVKNTHRGHGERSRRATKCPRSSVCALQRYPRCDWIEFFMLTSHPKTPDRTAAEAGRHVSRNIHNTGNFGASRETTDNGGRRDTAAADLPQYSDQMDPP